MAQSATIRPSKRGSGKSNPKPPLSVRARLMEAGRPFSDAELKVVRHLLANYPAAGLTTVSRLAKLAGVSDPTVLRLATRIGFHGFAELQETLLAEVQAHMRSPLTLATGDNGPPPSQPRADVYQAFLAGTVAQFGAAARLTATADYERAVALIADPRHRVLCLGGRFSRFIAGIMQRCLHHLRANTVLLEGNAADLVDELASIDRRHVLVVFDYRRYQADVVRFATQAKARGSLILLFTDDWKSPISAIADVTLIAPTATASPFDTLTTPLLQVEAVFAGRGQSLAADWRARAALLEEVRSENGITLGDDPSIHSKSKRREDNR